MTTQSNVCECRIGAGAPCTCGCQSAAPESADSCQCGEVCRCEGACTCSHCQHANAPAQERL